MDSLIETFHIDLRLLIAQTINFAIVIAVLYYFILKPVIANMQNRTDKIEKGIADAKKIEERLVKTGEDNKKIISDARKEAAIIVEQAREAAGQKKDEMLVRAKEEIGQTINEEKAKIQLEKAKILKEIKAEVAGLVAAATEKILEKKLDGKTDKEMIREVISEK